MALHPDGAGCSATSGADAGESIQRSRLARAMGMISLVFVGALLLKLMPGVGGSPPATDAGVGVGVEALAKGKDPQIVLDAVEEGLAVRGAEVSDAFATEVGFPPGAYDVRTAQGGAVVGYLLDCDADAASAAVSAQMERGGWTGVALGGVGGETYIKKEGECTWALFTYVQEGAATSVVVRCRADSE